MIIIPDIFKKIIHGNRYKIIKGTYSFELMYVESDKRMQLALDMREPVIFLDENIITNWEPPFDKLKITKEDKARMLKNIYKDLKYSGLKIILECHTF